jgi:DNA-directed RNA polymerase sigma subunit (sigma70/sigma32)
MANVIAAQAVKKYNPDMPGAAGLHTFVKSELQQLTRVARRSRSVLQVPERSQLDAFALAKSRRSFEDAHGREPDMGELADHSGFSLKRIEKVMQQTRPTPGEAAFETDHEKDATDFTPEAIDYVYHDADHVDRKILEHKIGHNGAEVLPPHAVAQKLGLTPSQLSRRSARLSLKINELEQSLRKL